MERFGLVAVHIDSVLEQAASACFSRAEEWAARQRTAYDLCDHDGAAVFKLRRDEADSCKSTIRSLKTFDQNEGREREFLKGVVLMLQTLSERVGRPEYTQGFQIFSAMYRVMDNDGMSWPFPIQPSTPPYSPDGPKDDPKKVA